MNLSSPLWQELSLLDFSNNELLLLHGYLCLALRHSQTSKLSSRHTIKNVLTNIETHLVGLELLSDNDIKFIKSQEKIFKG